MACTLLVVLGEMSVFVERWTARRRFSASLSCALADEVQGHEFHASRIGNVGASPRTGQWRVEESRVRVCRMGTILENWPCHGGCNALPMRAWEECLKDAYRGAFSFLVNAVDGAETFAAPLLPSFVCRSDRHCGHVLRPGTA